MSLSEALKECQKQLCVYDTTTSEQVKAEANERIIFLMGKYPQIKLNEATNKFYV